MTAHTEHDAAATLNVDLGDRSYPIFIGPDLLEKPLVARFIERKKAIVITNTTVGPLYLSTVTSMLERQGVEVASFSLPDGEQYKNSESLNQIYDFLMAQRADRKTALIALGGGVIGDLVGFAAASFQRGVPFVQIPTTLLSQVDSSVGGKTGINHPKGKNMIGAFYQPRCVLADTSTLTTLPDRELSAGLAEIIKYGLLWDREFFDWIEENLPRLRERQESALIEAIERSVRIKAEIVRQDEYEGGIRALLNLGHTFGHAIEAGLGYGKWLHGEAVGAGMSMAAVLSERLGLISTEERKRAQAVIAKAGLPTQSPAELTPQAMRTLMDSDKKVDQGQLRLVLLGSIGQARIVQHQDEGLLMQTLNECRTPQPA